MGKNQTLSLAPRDAEELAVARRYRPELHPLGYEWYFTEESATKIAVDLNSARSVLLIGAPTVAAALVDLGHERVTLVDANDLVLERLPGLRGLAAFHALDVDRAPVPGGPYDAVFFDSPWYEADNLRWLHRATAAVREGGRIQFVLFPADLRPGAAAERERVLAAAGGVGHVVVEPGVVAYETPLFEQEALRAAGEPVQQWRVGDLVHVKDVTLGPAATVEVPPPDPGRWESFRVGDQIVKVRPTPTGDDPAAELGALPGCPDDVLPSVSKRDPRRPAVGFWTSRNRVARVHDPELIRAAMTEIAAYAASGNAGDAPLRILSPQLRTRLKALLGVS